MSIRGVSIRRQIDSGRPGLHKHSMRARNDIIAQARIEQTILVVRGEKVILDADIAALYGVPTKALVQAVRRNAARFPPDFMFQMVRKELDNLRYRIGTSSLPVAGRMELWGGRRSLPYAFTEQGVAMLSGVLKSRRAVQVNVEIVRTFVKLRRMLASNSELARKLEALEQKYDGQFKVVFDAIRQLMTPDRPRVRPIGFRP